MIEPARMGTRGGGGVTKIMAPSKRCAVSRDARRADEAVDGIAVRFHEEVYCDENNVGQARQDRNWDLTVPRVKVSTSLPLGFGTRLRVIHVDGR